MRRILSVLLMLLMLLGTAAGQAEEALSAYDLALQMAEVIPDMEDIRNMPLENGPQNRAVWTDARSQLKCSLAVYDDPAAALEAAVVRSTRDTAVRNVDNCAVSVNCILGAEAVQAYQAALAQILDAEISGGEVRYMLNVNTRKIHIPACESVAQIKETNRLEYYEDYSGDRELLIELGYAPCQRCKP